jgi:hypothetical protein
MYVLGMVMLSEKLSAHGNRPLLLRDPSTASITVPVLK